MADVWRKQFDTAPQITSTLQRPPGTRADIGGADVELIVRGIRDENHAARRGPILFIKPANNDQSGAPTMGDVSYDLEDGDTDFDGGYVFEWRVTYTDATVETFRDAGYNTLAVLPTLDEVGS